MRARLEKSGVPPAQPLPARVTAGCGPPRRPGTAWSKGRGDPLRMMAKALRTAGPAVRAKRFGALEGGAPSTRESESKPGRSARGCGVEIRRNRWEVGPPSLANAGNEGLADLPRGESQPYLRGPGHRMRKHRDRGPLAKRLRESGDRIDPRRFRAIPGGRAAPETVRRQRHPSDGRYRAPTRATGLESMTPVPIPVCAGIAARRPARVVNGIWNRAGNAPSGV